MPGSGGVSWVGASHGWADACPVLKMVRDERNRLLGLGTRDGRNISVQACAPPNPVILLT